MSKVANNKEYPLGRTSQQNDVRQIFKALGNWMLALYLSVAAVEYILLTSDQTTIKFNSARWLSQLLNSSVQKIIDYLLNFDSLSSMCMTPKTRTDRTEVSFSVSLFWTKLFFPGNYNDIFWHWQIFGSSNIYTTGKDDYIVLIEILL